MIRKSEEMKKKKIILTIDYELFLGKETGTVRESLIEPTGRLLGSLEKNDSKMTVFWDILHYYRLLEYENKYPELKQDRLLIEEQIFDMVRRGHDIQLHLHPHWLDAVYEDGKWVFTYERFKLLSLSDINNPDDINTITGCVTITKKLMEDLIRKIDPSYKITAFRAGGYLIEPFCRVRDALYLNDIRIDSSVCPYLVNNNGDFSYDFLFYPTELKYGFEYTPQNKVETGRFTEVPITTVKIPRFLNIFFTLIRIIKYPSLESERKGTGAGEYSLSDEKITVKKFIPFLHPRINQLTTDSNYEERFNYIFKKVPDYSTMILHPKLLNTHTLTLLDNYLTDDKVEFISIKQFVKG